MKSVINMKIEDDEHYIEEISGNKADLLIMLSWLLADMVKKDESTLKTFMMLLDGEFIGAHIEKPFNKFQRMKIRHPERYKYCMEQLGLKELCEYANIPIE